jgi:hypothetical protein
LVRDLNRDGVPDLLVPNSDASGAISIWLGQAGGTVSAVATTAAGGSPVGTILVEDFNGDGNLDILSISNHTDLLPGKGDGTFGVPIQSSQTFPVELVAGDADADGDVDVVYESLGKCFLSKNDGHGSFSNVGPPWPTCSSDLKLVDLDRDGKLDLLTSNASSLLVYPGPLFGSGNAVITVVPQMTKLQMLAIADFDVDGNVDVATSDGVHVGVIRGTGMTALGSALAWGAGASPGALLLAGDLDGNGKPDLVSVGVVAGSGALGTHFLINTSR